MDPITPGIAKGFNLLRLAGDVVRLSIFYIAAGGAPLEIAVELDPIGGSI